ncbi:probable sodium/metabolite cotransporter BASS4, chloroplastic [Tanacetum coccineum]
MGTVAEYHNVFEMFINRVTRISESLLKMFYISGLKLTIQIEQLRARPITLGEAFSLAHIIEARFEAIIKGSLDADEDIGVDEVVSSAIDGVFDIGESNVESMEVHSKFGEFSKNKESVEEVVVAEKGCCAMSKTVEGGREKRVLVAIAEDRTALFLEPQYSPSLILVPILVMLKGVSSVSRRTMWAGFDIITYPSFVENYDEYSGVGVSVPADKLFKSLFVTVLIPLIMGKVLRDYVKGATDIVDSNRKLFVAFGSILLSLIPWVQISRSRPLLLMVNPEVALVAVIMGAVLHIVLLCLNSIWVQILCSRSDVNKSSFANKDVAMGKEAKIKRRIWDLRIKIFLDNTLREGGFEGVESINGGSGSGSESGRGGDDQRGGDEDAYGDDDI